MKWSLDIAEVFPEAKFDDAVFYLAGRARGEAEALKAADSIESAARLARLDAYARAMALLPVASARAIEAKLGIAGWTVDRGTYVLQLAEGLIETLIASARADEAEVGPSQPLGFPSHSL